LKRSRTLYGVVLGLTTEVILGPDAGLPKISVAKVVS
jgi:hypothetical protein